MIHFHWQMMIVYFTAVLMYSINTFSQLKAFPTAEGYGRLAVRNHFIKHVGGRTQKTPGGVGKWLLIDLAPTVTAGIPL